MVWVGLCVDLCLPVIMLPSFDFVFGLSLLHLVLVFPRSLLGMEVFKQICRANTSRTHPVHVVSDLKEMFVKKLKTQKDFWKKKTQSPRSQENHILTHSFKKKKKKRKNPSTHQDAKVVSPSTVPAESLGCCLIFFRLS